MSKKMLKRSLALGALMAFVITGQAWAESTTLRADYEAVSGIFEHTDFSGLEGEFESYRDWDLGINTLKVTGTVTKSNMTSAVYANYYKFIGGEGSTLQISKKDGTALEGMGMITHGTVDVDNLLIDVTDKGIYASASSEGQDTNITANNISITSTNGVAVFVNDGGHATITPGESLTLKSTGESAVTVGGGCDLSIASDSDSEIKADIKIEGDVLTVNNGKLEIKLETKKSTIIGAINAYENMADNPDRKITLSNGATWNNNGASNVTLLTMKDGIINQESDSDIVIKEYTGSGTANFKANGKILIDEAASSASLSLASEKDTPENVVAKLGVKEDAKGLKATITRAAGAVTGDTTWAVDYEQADKDNDGYFIAKLGEKSESVNPVNESIAEMHSIALMAWRAENNDMHKRLGELRDANGEHGAWARMTRGESEYESVKNQYNAYQLGYDQKAGDWTVGAAVTYTEGETSFAEGNGENDHTGLAVYGSKLNGDGSYLDLIAKYAKLDHEYTVSGGIGSGEYDTDGFALSAEYGKRFEQGNGLWIEPQVELTYGLVDSVGFAAENGRVSLDDMNSLVGRVGFRAGKDVKDGNVYVRASYLYDFEGETDIAFTDGVDTRSFKQDLGGGWWEFGIGTNINLSKATYIYADVEHACGGEVDTDWKWNLGVRYSF